MEVGVGVGVFVCVVVTPQWGTKNGEINLPTSENPELSFVLRFRGWSRKVYGLARFV